MAKGRIEQEIVVKVLGGKEVVELEKQIKALEKAKAEIVVDVDADEAVKQLEVIDKTIAELKGEKAEIEVEAKVANALDALDDVAKEAKDAEAAAEALSRALGPELTARANVDDIVADFQRMDLSLTDIAQNADRLGGKLRQLDASTTGGLETAMRRTRGSVDGISDSARGANSALANMVGNATQDVGALGGVAGSAGVAIGQMAEYAADAALGGEKLSSALVSMAGVAAPIAGIALTLQNLANIQKASAASAENAATNVEQWTEAMLDGGDAAENMANIMAETNKVLFDTRDAMGLIQRSVEDTFNLGIGPGTKFILDRLGLTGAKEQLEDITPLLGKANVKIEQFLELVASEDPERAQDDLELALSRTTLSADEQGTILDTLRQHQRAYAESTANAAAIESVFGTELDDTGDALKRNTGAHERNMFRINQRREAQEAAVEAEKEAAEAYTEWAEAAEDANRILSSGPTLEGGVAGAKALMDQLFGLTRIASANEAAFDALGETLKENGHTFDVNTEKGRANQQVLESLAESLIPQIAANYKNAAGNLTAFTQSMDALKTGVFQQLRDETDLTDRQIGDIINRLGIFDGSKYSAQFELLGLEDAESKVALLLPLLETLNVAPDIIRTVSLQVIAGDAKGALQSIQTGISNAPKPAVPLTATPPTARELANVSTGVSNTLARYPAKLPVVPFLDTRSISQRAARAFFENLDSGGTADGFGAIAGERGPEILNERYLTTGPTYVPPGTRVTSRRKTAVILNRRGGNLRRYDSGGTVPFGPITVNFNGVGTIGNTAHVDRQVRRSLQRIERIYGTR